MSSHRRVVVVGGGMLGAAVARACVRAGHGVVLLEAAPALGGLTSSHTLETSDGPVTVDRFYHVILKSDRRVQRWLGELGLLDELSFTPVASTVVVDGQRHPASSLMQMATLPFIGPTARARIAASIALGAVLPSGPWFSRVPAHRWLSSVAGTSATEQFWEPLLRAKLGPFAGSVSAQFLHATFRRLLVARLQGSGADLFAVVPGGYARILGRAADQLDAQGVDVRLGAATTRVERSGGVVKVSYETDAGPVTIDADDVVVTTPATVARRIIAGLPDDVAERMHGVPYLGVINVTALLRSRPDPAYVTYIVDRRAEITSVIGMHALIPPATTRGRYLVHLPRYCSPDDPMLRQPDDVVVAQFLAALHQVYPSLEDDAVEVAAVARAPHVMPVPLVGYPARAPRVDTGVPGVHLVSSAQLTDGTLNVESTLALSERSLPRRLGGLA